MCTELKKNLREGERTYCRRGKKGQKAINYLERITHSTHTLSHSQEGEDHTSKDEGEEKREKEAEGRRHN